MPVVLPTPSQVQEPCLAVGEGAIWVGDTELHQVDPRNGSLMGTVVDPAGSHIEPVAISIGLDDVWVAEDWRIHRIDPGDREVLDGRRFSEPASGITSLLIAFGDVWVSFEEGVLVRVEAIDGLPILKEFEVRGVPSDTVAAAETVWVTDEFGELVGIDPGTNQVSKRIRLGGAPTTLTATEDHLWIADRGGVVDVVDLRTRSIRTGIAVSGEPVDIAAGLDAVWVADRTGRLIRLHPTTFEIDGVFELDGLPAAIAIDESEGVIWVRTAASKYTD
jgi:hypothetical protein